MTETEQQLGILRVLVQYLLFERKQETQLRLAFSALVQERHNQFHTIGERREGDGTSFTECKNELCSAAKAILAEGRAMAVEINDLSIKLISDYTLKVQKGSNACRAFLVENSQIEQEKKLVTI